MATINVLVITVSNNKHIVQVSPEIDVPALRKHLASVAQALLDERAQHNTEAIEWAEFVKANVNEGDLIIPGKKLDNGSLSTCGVGDNAKLFVRNAPNAETLRAAEEVNDEPDAKKARVEDAEKAKEPAMSFEEKMRASRMIGVMEKAKTMKLFENFDAFVEEVNANFTRVPLLPEVEEAAQESASDATRSKFGGRPWLNDAEEWPTCKSCDLPMGFHCQQRLEDIPRSDKNQTRQFPQSGLLQVFVCQELCGCDPDEGYYLTRIVRPGSGQSLKELVAASVKKARISTEDAGLPSDVKELVEKSSGTVWGNGKLGEYPENYPKDMFPLRYVTAWKEGNSETPDNMEVGRLVLAHPDIEDEVSDHFVDNGPAAGIKVNGWPSWIQDVAYPSCPQCQGDMKLFYIQIEETQGIAPFMWGDAGCGTICGCPDHPELVELTWACH